MDVPTEEQEVSAHRTPQSEVSVPGREVPTSSGYENHPELHMGEREGWYKTRHPLKRPEHKLTCSQTLALSYREGTAAQQPQKRMESN